MPSLTTGHIVESLSEPHLKQKELSQADHVRSKAKSDGFDVSTIHSSSHASTHAHPTSAASSTTKTPSPRFSITTSPTSDYRALGGSLSSSSPPSSLSTSAQHNLNPPPEKTLSMSHSNKTSPRLSPTKTSPSTSFSLPKPTYHDAGLDGTAWHAVTTANLMLRERSTSKTSPRSPKTSPSHSPRLDAKKPSVATNNAINTVSNNGISNYFNAVVASNYNPGVPIQPITPSPLHSNHTSQETLVVNNDTLAKHKNKNNTNSHILLESESHLKPLPGAGESSSTCSTASATEMSSLLSSSNNSEMDVGHDAAPVARVVLRAALPPLPTPPNHESANVTNTNAFS
jgi:hypothetical protein